MSRRLSSWVMLLYLAAYGSAAYAQFDFKGQLDFLRDLYARHDKNLQDYLVREFQQYLAMPPDSLAAAEAQYLMAKVLEEKGEMHSALAAHLKVSFLYPTTTYNKLSAEAACKIIAAEEPYQRMQEELKLFLARKYLDFDPASRFYEYVQLLKTLGAPGQYDWTLQQLAEFVQRFPNDARLDAVFVWSAEMLAKKNLPREAVAGYARIDYVFPQSRFLPLARYRRGVLLSQELGDQKAALEALQQVVAQSDTSAYAAPALFMMGTIKRDKIKDARGALADFRKLVDTYPQSDKVLDVLFACASLQSDYLKNYTGALAAYDEIVGKFKTDQRGAEALEKAAEVCRDKMQDYNKAAEYYARVAELYPSNEKAPDLLLKAGVLGEERLKDSARASHYYNSVLQKFPDSKKADEARRKLAKLQGH